MTRRDRITPEDLGLKSYAQLEKIAIRSPGVSGSSGERSWPARWAGRHREIVLANAAAALWVGG